MAQFRGLRVYILNNGTNKTVRQVWKGNIINTNGLTYNAAEPVTWSGGAGVYVTDNGSTIDFYRTSGLNPVAGSIILGGTTGASRTIGSFPAENLSLTHPIAAYPANFNTTGGTQGPILVNDEFFISGQPAGRVSATIGSDYFDLVDAWSGSTLTNVEATVNRDRTAIYGLLIPKQDSRIPFAILEETLRLIDSILGGMGGGAPPTDFTPLLFSGNWRNVGGGAAVLEYCYYPSTQQVQLKGFVDTNNTVVTVGLASATIVAAGGLPSGRRPAERLDFEFGGERISVDTDGSIKYTSPGQVSVIPGEIAINCVFRADGS